MGTDEEKGLLTHLQGQIGGREGDVGSREPTKPVCTSSMMEVPPLFRVCPFLVIMFILTQWRTSHSEATVYLLQGKT